MATASNADPHIESTIVFCASTLGKMAGYALEPSLQRRLHDLCEREEFLGPEEHDERLALVDFTQRRTIESVEAKLALKRLRDSFPEATALP
ncbi:MAG: hypothetical protein P4L84_27985 [Isosphaeraceae bacterium]|nr:hypothetical protein [Isosphaeraceae bacterium]